MSEETYRKLVDGHLLDLPRKEIVYRSGNPIRYELDRLDFETIAKGIDGGEDMNFFSCALGALVSSIILVLDFAEMPEWKRDVSIALLSVSGAFAVYFGLKARKNRKKSREIYENIKKGAEQQSMAQEEKSIKEALRSSGYNI